MNKTLIGTIAALSLAATDASASYIGSFSRTTNDGVYTLSAAQVTLLGYAPTLVDRIGFFRVREGTGQTFNNGDTFDATSLFASTNNDSSIVAFLNGTNVKLNYAGSTFQPLGTTTIATTTSGSGNDNYVEGVAFLFNSSAGNIVFNGSSTFNGSQTRGEYPSIASPVPLPAAAWLFVPALLGLVGVGRRRLA